MPSSEPTAWSGAITALAIAAIPFLRAFGVNITEQQGDAIMTLLAALIVVGTLLLRSKVVTTGKATDAVTTALQSPAATSDAHAKTVATQILADAKT